MRFLNRKSRLISLIFGIAALAAAAMSTHAWFADDVDSGEFTITATRLDVALKMPPIVISNVWGGDSGYLTNWSAENNGERNVVIKLDISGIKGTYGKDNSEYGIRAGDPISADRMKKIVEYALILDDPDYPGELVSVDACFKSPYSDESGVYYIRLLSGGYLKEVPIEIAFTKYFGGNAILEDGTRDRNRPEEQGSVFTYGISCTALQNTREAVVELWGARVAELFDENGTVWN